MIRLALLALAVLLSVDMAGTAFSAPLPAQGIDPCLFDRLAKFHGHTCAGSLMGARLGLAAKLALQAAGGEGRLKSRYSNHSCPLDGIQLAAGTTFGNKAIEVVEEKGQRLILTAEKNGRQVEARLSARAEEKGKKYRDLKAKATALSAASPERQRLEKGIEDLLEWFRTAPDVEVVHVRVVR